MSMKPGATTSPEASITRAASALARLPTASILPRDTPTSAGNRARPEPSTTVPPRISVSNANVPPLALRGSLAQ
jgi:hypothetical protein